MLWTKLNLILPTVLMLSGCAVMAPAKVVTPLQDEPSIISAIPEQLESFDYQGYRYFDENTDGFTLRYSNIGKHRLADVFIYPVSKENRALPHDQLVMGSTRATIQAIGSAVKTGQYANFNVIGAATRARGIRTVARVEATYLRENLASYTLVYQTEYEGTLVKVRVSMPDNAANRDSEEWDRFANTLFDTIIGHIEGQGQVALPNKERAKI
ncbi:MAG: hypothetical protein V3U65_14845 [Granulosicoccaceae bacterium]